MPDETAVSTHYTQGGLLQAIETGVARLGKTPDSVTLDDLGPVDEFHIGGRGASEAFLDQLAIAPDHRVLDIGCGLGGPARFTASRYRCAVEGIDLTAEFVDTGRALNAWVGLEDQVMLVHGSALSMPYGDARFDHAYMMHVGMNIADKSGLFAEAARVLKPRGCFGIYDVMQTGDGEIAYPVPWSGTAETSSLATPGAYREGLEAAGFEIMAERNRRDFAIAFFERMAAQTQQAGGPPPLGLHLVMGQTARLKFANLVANLAAGHVAPIELIARKSG